MWSRTEIKKQTKRPKCMTLDKITERSRTNRNSIRWCTLANVLFSSSVVVVVVIFFFVYLFDRAYATFLPSACKAIECIVERQRQNSIHTHEPDEIRKEKTERNTKAKIQNLSIVAIFRKSFQNIVWWRNRHKTGIFHLAQTNAMKERYSIAAEAKEEKKNTEKPFQANLLSGSFECGMNDSLKLGRNSQFIEWRQLNTFSNYIVISMRGWHLLCGECYSELPS